MKLEMTNFRAIATNLVAEGEVCDLAHPDISTQPKTGTEIAPLIDRRHVDCRNRPADGRVARGEKPLAIGGGAN
jgi:hypothetical protein